MARSQAAPGYQLVQVTDLTAGVDLRHQLTQLAPQRARRLVNWDLGESGSLRVYPGHAAFTTSLGSRRIQGAARIYIKRGVGSTFTLVCDNGNVYKPNDSGTWGSAVLASGVHTSNAVFFIHDRDHVAIFDGANAPQKSIDGSTWTKMGIEAPTAAPTLAAVAGGSLLNASTYGVVYTYHDAEYVYEGNGSDATTQAMTTPNLTIRCTIPRATDPQVDTIYVYARNNTTGESVYRRVGSVANPVAGSATFDITAENWNANVEVPTDHDVWPACKFGVVWKNRWWGIDKDVGNRLHFSQIFLPQAKPTLFYIDLPFEQGDDIKGVAPLGDVLVVWGYRRSYLVIGQTSLDFEVRPSLGSLAGVLGPRAWAQLETGLIHAAADGIYLFDGATDRLLSHDIETAWEDYVANTPTSDLERTPVVYHLKRKELRVGVTRLYPTTGAGEWILFLARTRGAGRESWGSTDRSVGGYLHWDGPESVQGAYGRLFTWNLTAARLYEEATGTTAAGSDITATYEGPGLTTGIHTARFIDFFGEYEPNSGQFGAEIAVDGTDISTHTIDTGNAGSAYGTAVYGTGTYAGTSRRKWSKMLPLAAEGRTAQVNLQYTGQTALTIYSYAVGVVPEPMVRGF